MRWDDSGEKGRAVARPRRCWRYLLLVISLAVLAGPALAAATLQVELLVSGQPTLRGARLNGPIPAPVAVPFTIVVKINHGKVGDGVKLPLVDGLTLNGSGTDTQPQYVAYNFFVIPERVGDFTIPAFDVRTDDGETLHAAAISLHVVKW